MSCTRPCSLSGDPERTEDPLFVGGARRAAADGVPAISGDTGWLLQCWPRRWLRGASSRLARDTGVRVSGSPGPWRRTACSSPSSATRRARPWRASMLNARGSATGQRDGGRSGAARAQGGRARSTWSSRTACKDEYEALLDRLVGLLRPGGVPGDGQHPLAGRRAARLSRESAHSAESTAIITRYSARLAADPRLATVFLPVGDGVAVSAKRHEGAPR